MVHPYLWIAIVGGFVAFLMGAGVGMNDLSNAFGTTYGAKVLTLLQICILASICEFTGAVSLGGAVTSTISGGIANTNDFADRPYLFMYGMLCAGGAAFCWLALATWLVLPVSSTHSICGGVIGFALVHGGGGSVYWAKRQDEFPFVGGVVPIVASWFISPLLTGVVAAIIYGLVRFFVMRPANSASRAMYSLPLIVALAFFLESFFVLFKGAKNRLHWEVQKAAWVGACIGLGCGIVSIAFIPLLKRRLRYMAAKAAAMAEEEGRPISVLEMELMANGSDAEDPPNITGASVPGGKGTAGSPAATAAPPNAAAAAAAANDDMDTPKKQGKQGMGTMTGAVVHERNAAGSAHLSDDGERSSSEETAEAAGRVDAGAAQTASGLQVDIFSSEAEYVYRYLQIFTAVCASFAHGASDVSNAVGPFAAIYGVYEKGHVDFGSDTPVWILCLGGAGLIVGLSTFGVRLMRLLGEKITVITPSRGFSAELSAALVVSFASGYGIPVSSTHCITGAVVAISMMDVGVRKVRWMMVLKMYSGWVFTLVVTAVFSATFFAQGVNSPSRV